MKAARLILALALCWLLCASKNRADEFGNRAWGKSAYQSVITPDDELQTLVRYQENPTGYGEIASGQEVWTKFDPLGLFLGTPLTAGELIGAATSGAAQGLYDNTVGSAVQSYHSGEQHMEGGFNEIANAHSALDVTIGVLGIVAATGDATGAAMAVTPEGKMEKVAADGAEKLAAKETEQVAAATVEQKTESTVSSSAKADVDKAADKTAAATDPAADKSPSAARREAMRDAGIPTSQQPTAQTSVKAPDGTSAGRQYTYETPKPGGGTQTQSVQHSLTDADHDPHWEAGPVKPGGQTDSLGRPRLTNDKVKVDDPGTTSSK